ncbi:hypothetical protein RvY_15930 [Ramazzottius varieornatus]|uniref:Uncharacterized protein n=1 Tax=Ramazzottius varieornatus TaxID=947166 RepID=A0A1D1VY26_RAMVA|nr:hypothetical protein RvY_15930 [Ramazzottius varieornatus]
MLSPGRPAPALENSREYFLSSCFSLFGNLACLSISTLQRFPNLLDLAAVLSPVDYSYQRAYYERAAPASSLPRDGDIGRLTRFGKTGKELFIQRLFATTYRLPVV